MTTDELRALLLECHKILSLMGRTLESSPNLIDVRCSYCGGVVRHFEKCDLKENISKIDAALSSDFAVVPRKITKEMSDALNAMAQCEGFIEEGYNDMIKVAEKK